MDRSHQAAMSIGEAVTRLEEAVVAWQAETYDTIGLTAAYNETARAVAVQSMALIDAELRNQVQNHIQLAGRARRGSPEDGQESVAAEHDDA
jgi:hypothetical protein